MNSFLGRHLFFGFILCGLLIFVDVVELIKYDRTLFVIVINKNSFLVF